MEDDTNVYIIMQLCTGVVYVVEQKHHNGCKLPAYVHVGINTRTFTDIHTHLTHTHTGIYLHTLMRTHIYIHATHRTHTLTHMNTHIHTHTLNTPYVHTHTHARMHTCTGGELLKDIGHHHYSERTVRAFAAIGCKYII
jgi:hypothetical protein